MYRILLLLLLPIASFAQIQFETGNWQEALAKAKQQNKPIFLDIYASWCAPCKQLEQQVYSRKEVGDVMNKSFINVKIDGEVGEGIQLQNQFAIGSYPTLIFLKPNGDRFYSFVGYRNPEEFLEEVKGALEEMDKPTISDFAAAYGNGKREKKFLADYLDALSVNEGMQLYSQAVVDDYVAQLTPADTQDEVVARRLWNQLPAMRAGSSSYQFFVKHLDSFQQYNPFDEEKAIVGNELRRAVASYTAYYDVKRAIQTKNASTFAEATANFSQVSTGGTAWFSDPAATVRTLQRDFYEQTGNTEKILELVEQEAELYTQQMNQEMQRAKTDTSFVSDTNWGDLFNNAAWYFYENTTDQQRLTKALQWSKKSLELNQEPAFMDTYARLLGKFERFDEAIELERKAIAKAFEFDEPTTDYWKALISLKNERNELKEPTPLKPSPENLKQHLASYLHLVKERRIDEFMDFLPVRIFDYSPQETLSELFYTTYHSKQLPISITQADSKAVSPIFVHDGTSYALVTYAMTLHMDVSAFPAEQLPVFLSTLKQTYGEKNVMHDQATNHFIVQSQANMFALAEPNSSTWKFVNREESNPVILNALIPMPVQEHFR